MIAKATAIQNTAPIHACYPHGMIKLHHDSKPHDARC
jgi:hypothetical protein